MSKNPTSDSRQMLESVQSFAQNPPQRPDRVQFSRETRSGNDSDWLQHWYDKHEGRVFYVSSSNDQKLDALKLERQEWKALKRRKDNGTYHLAGFKESLPGEIKDKKTEGFS
jgi:hypothetical protein